MPCPRATAARAFCQQQDQGQGQGPLQSYKALLMWVSLLPGLSGPCRVIASSSDDTVRRGKAVRDYPEAHLQARGLEGVPHGQGSLAASLGRVHNGHTCGACPADGAAIGACTKKKQLRYVIVSCSCCSLLMLQPWAPAPQQTNSQLGWLGVRVSCCSLLVVQP